MRVLVRAPLSSSYALTFGVTWGESLECLCLTTGDLMKFSIECEREDDGRWLAEVPELPGVLAYGSTAEEAQVLALCVLAERLEHGETRPVDISISAATV